MPQHLCSFGAFGEAGDGPHPVPLNTGSKGLGREKKTRTLKQLLKNHRTKTLVASELHVEPLNALTTSLEPHPTQSPCLLANSFSSSSSSFPSSWNPPPYWETRCPENRPAPAPPSAGRALSPAPDDTKGSSECKCSSPQSDTMQRETGELLQRAYRGEGLDCKSVCVWGRLACILAAMRC